MSWQKIRLHLSKLLLSNRVVYVMAKNTTAFIKVIVVKQSCVCHGKNTTAFIKVIVVKQSCVCHGEKYDCIY